MAGMTVDGFAKFKPDELDRLQKNFLSPKVHCRKYDQCDKHRDNDGRTACELCLDPTYRRDLSLWTQEFLKSMNEGCDNEILRGDFRYMHRAGMFPACAWQAIFEFCFFAIYEVKSKTNLANAETATVAIGKASVHANENSRTIKYRLDQSRSAFRNSRIRGNEELRELAQRMVDFSTVAGMVVEDHKSVIKNDAESLDCMRYEGHKYLEVIQPANMRLRCWSELGTILNHGILMRLDKNERKNFVQFTEHSLHHNLKRSQKHDGMLRSHANQISPGLYDLIEDGPATPKLLEMLRAYAQKLSQLPKDLRAKVDALLTNRNAETEVPKGTPMVDPTSQKHLSRGQRSRLKRWLKNLRTSD